MFYIPLDRPRDSGFSEVPVLPFLETALTIWKAGPVQACLRDPGGGRCPDSWLAVRAHRYALANLGRCVEQAFLVTYGA